ncbi:MAG: C26 family cysteine hydrolase domain-containing family [Candidatus Marinimicrobia bacterium]|nr:C26 family cysteine hydrolase domain-containing family [Gammaproteobacteria bacterium]MBT4605558.1 C26 family cysteine hydrolase domain-containing family [Thiotrichales bacterium]MBT4948040.1 C26 family cysteine hydrolase domain-containing family [Candidatus Neomarinimicrobiota bacterium]MBT5371319.1 C26 family cysteine hydrolase domain-containing family [Gammaproteobacteria bacterium]MBT6217730.1 C26 family cysteine hydrolase domain-containing family [Candidatus Neomarinimicrobiota bacteriu
MIIAVMSQRVDYIADRDEWRDAIDQRLIEFMVQVGVLVVPIPNQLIPQQHSNKEWFQQWIDCVKPHAIVLSGGNDISTCHSRDAVEMALLDYAKEHQLPLLGICRGMQMMGVWSGGSLSKVNGHVRKRHLVVGEINKEVNSFHALSLERCPNHFSILANSKGGEIEAIRHKELPWEGWMWHPEREPIFDNMDIERVRALFYEGNYFSCGKR